MGQYGKLRATTTKSGHVRYDLEIRHVELGKYQVIRGDDRHLVEQMARARVQQWDEQWARQVEAQQKREARQAQAQNITAKKAEAEQRTQETQAVLAGLNNLLPQALDLDDVLDWDTLKNHENFPTPAPQPPPAVPPLPPKPQRDDPDFHTYLNILDLIIKRNRAFKNAAALERFNEAVKQWHAAKEQRQRQITEQDEAYEAAVAKWAREEEVYLRERDAHNAAIDQKRTGYLAGESEAVKDYCRLVLSNSRYPDFFPQTFDVDYIPQSHILIVDYQLPDIRDIPTLVEVRYVQSRGEFVEKRLSEAHGKALYDHILYQIALRTIHELFEADRANALTAVAFNGYVTTLDATSGHETLACLLSINVTKENFKRINLANIDPKACFRSLRGVAATNLHSLTPIAPVLRMNREDSRFVDPQAVMDELQAGENLASMPWEDFEHLIRELFEREFSTVGGEVKVTRASRDGGVDAVVFDPDPIRGGKIIIQAKRYTNTVGVSVVRDLYGMVMNEGANKGILVTTSTYGTDAYEFAQGKPLVLLSGSELLHLLEKHGHKARIDLKEAKRPGAEQSS